MSVDRLRDLLTKSRGEKQTGFEPDPSWRRYLADSARQRDDDREFRPEKDRKGHSPARIALTSLLTVLVLALMAVVSTEVIPLAKSLPSPIDKFQAVLAEFHLNTGGDKKSNNVVVAVPKKRRGHAVSETQLDEPLPPYKGTVRAELSITPLNTVRPFKVQVEDGRKRQNLDIIAKPVIVDIGEEDPGVVTQTSIHEDSLQPFDQSFDLSGPEADRIATVLTGGNEGVPARNIERHVGLLAVIDRTGKVTNIRRVNGSAALAQAAIDTARRSQFKQFYQDGKPVDMQTSITVSFTIPRS